MAKFVELHVGEADVVLVNIDRVEQVSPSPIRGKARIDFVSLDGGGCQDYLTVEESYEDVRTLLGSLQGCIPTSPYLRRKLREGKA